MSLVLSNYRKAIQNKELVRWEEVTPYPTGNKVGDVSITPIFDEQGICTHLIGTTYDITKRKQAEASLREQEYFLSQSQRCAHIGSWWWDMKGPIKWSNELYNVYEVSPESFTPTIESLLSLIHPEDRSKMQRWLEACGNGQSPDDFEFRIVLSDGSVRFINGSGDLIRDSEGVPIYMAGTGQDITERKLAEIEKNKLEAQLQQAQKMESVGRLAGGVAHDFNNMLQVILGNAYLAMNEVPKDSSVWESLKEIKDSANRSADLTQKLLTFARKQVVMPQVIDLNDTVKEMLKILWRLIGEDIDLEWLPGTGVWLVKVDPSQIDQILANLCVNARDAIDDVGKITIETKNSILDNDYCANHLGFVSGEYVCLSVSDNGCGINKETLEHIFEPFFTTKEFGKGTGLGLATVYGAIKQNNGFINAYSEPGQGTTFTIYLPRYMDEKELAGKKSAEKNIPGGTETVLLVEDEPTIIKLGKRMLEQLGYQVLTAITPEEAVRQAEEYAGEIHLLLTDVVMPGMNGRDLTQCLLVEHPKIKCLFMSGYTADVIARHGVLDEGVNFIQKPFSMEDLAIKVREAIEE